ncbi:MAG: phosphoribosylglycinamide formyltransferase [Bacteroidales bacterium]|nr:phosphoribosylglycinamide formyltransferase [Bacteroidales bacterium]MCF8328314.1 phosphoribosylglycinamide formyltransferase [Bacteroidales bacterium]
MTNFAIFASGNGSNAENIIQYFKDHKFIRCALVVSNKKNAHVLERAKKHDIPAAYIPTHIFRENPEEAINTLEKHNIDFIVLAGFMVLVPSAIIQRYPNKIINIHPALLPDYGGKGMYGDNVHQAIIQANEKQSGISIHYVNEKYDDGQVIFQAACPVSKDDTVESLKEKVHQLEYEHYPPIIEQAIEETRSFG